MRVESQLYLISVQFGQVSGWPLGLNFTLEMEPLDVKMRLAEALHLCNALHNAEVVTGAQLEAMIVTSSTRR